jgi:hypothetical protein
VELSRARLLLVDNSAWARGAVIADVDAELCLCAVTRLEILYSVRSPADYEAVKGELAHFRDLRMDVDTFAAAEAGQRELARLGQHRVALPDPHRGLRPAACRRRAACRSPLRSARARVRVHARAAEMIARRTRTTRRGQPSSARLAAQSHPTICAAS